MRAFIYLLLIGTAIFSEIGPAQESTSSSTFKIETIEVRPDIEPARSYIGKEYDEEIEEETLRNQQANTISDVVEQVPGLDNMGGPRKESQAISIRGYRPQQVLLLLDGTRQNFSMSHNSIIPVRMHLLKKIDVVKGGASSRFGSGALGGLVSFTTLDPVDLTGSSQALTFQLRNMYSSVSDLNQFSVTGASSWDRGTSGLIIDGTRTYSDDVTLSDGEHLSFSAYEDQSVWAKSTFSASGGHHFWLSGDWQEKASETPFNPQAGAFTANDVAIQDEKYGSLRLQYKNKSANDFQPEAVLYTSRTEMTRKRQSDLREDVREVETIGTSLHSVYRVVKSDGFNIDLKPGAEYVRDFNNGRRDGGELSSFPDGDMVQTGAYMLSDIVYGKWWAEAGVRFDHVQIETESSELSSQSHQEWSPQIEIGRLLTEDLNFSVGYEEGYNAPKIQEIFVDGLHFQDGDFLVNYFVPNPDLKPESSQTIEANVSYDFVMGPSEGQIKWTEYYSTVHNYIDQEIRIMEEETQFVNRDEVEFRGREISLSQNYRLFDFKTGYSQVRSLKTENGQPLSRTPQDHVFAGLEYSPNRWSLGFTGHFYREQDRIDRTDFENVPSTPAFELFNAFMAYQFGTRWAQNAGVVRFRVNNVFEREYQLHGTPLKGPGRDFRLELVMAL